VLARHLLGVRSDAAGDVIEQDQQVGLKMGARRLPKVSRRRSGAWRPAAAARNRA